MTRDRSPAADMRGPLVATLLTTAALVALPVAATAQARTLEGAWGVTIQRVDCTTSAPQGPAVRALTTFHLGGTLNESSGATAFVPGQRSIGHGSWGPGGGATYTDRTVTLLLFETAPNTPPGSPGFQAGWETTSHTYTLSSADRFTATGTAQFYDVNRQLYRSACTLRSGERIK